MVCILLHCLYFIVYCLDPTLFKWNEGLLNTFSTFLSLSQCHEEGWVWTRMQARNVSGHDYFYSISIVIV